MRTQQVSPLIPTKSFRRPVFFDLTPAKEKSTDNPWPWCIARFVELGPGAAFVILALIHVEHQDSTSDRRLNFGTPSINSWAEYKYSLHGWPRRWCQRIRSVSTRILLTGMDCRINSRKGVASRASYSVLTLS